MPEGEYFQYGGQAVIEGVMMRSPRYFAVACRGLDGEIVVHSERISSTWLGKLTWLKKPFLRGMLALIDSMALGIKALNFSSKVQLSGITTTLLSLIGMGALCANTPSSDDKNEKKPQAINQTIQDAAVGGTMIFGLVIGLLLFVVLPTYLTGLIGKKFHWSHMTLNALDGVIRIIIFVGYVAVIGMSKEIQRVFQYHGAEHKSINAYEKHLPVTVENALKQSRLHVRCGTSFVVIVLLLSIIIFSFLPRPPFFIRIPLHIAVLPLIAAIAYELIRFAGRYCGAFGLRLAFGPGLITQYLTTREPEPDQVEVAVAALTKVIELEAEERNSNNKPNEENLLPENLPENTN